MTRQIFSVVGLGFGDEGKGTTVDWLARRHPTGLVVRFNGGAQAAHNVVEPDGRHHTFSQFGSGTLAGVPTHLTSDVVVYPSAMLREAQTLAGKGIPRPMSLVTVEDRALVTTRFHVAANRLRELARGAGRHGSCGMGVGETVDLSLSQPIASLRVSDVDRRAPAPLRRLLGIQQAVLCELTNEMYLRLYAESNDDAAVEDKLDALGNVLTSPVQLDEELERLTTWRRAVRVVGDDWLTDHLRTTDAATIFEGAQGVLLDQYDGFFPHVTRSSTTLAHAERRIMEAQDGGDTGPVTRLGVTRTYHTRQGAGPMPTEDPARGDLLLSNDHNLGGGEWQGRIRAGALDLTLLRFAVSEATGTMFEKLDGLVVTHVDKVDPTSMRVAVGYDDKNLVDTLVDRDFTRDDHERCYLNHADRTAALARAVPHYETMSLDEVAERIGLPIRLRSCGQTYLDKEWAE